MPDNYWLIIAVSTGKVLELLIITISLCSEGSSLTSFLFVLAPDRFNDPNSPQNLISFSKVTGGLPGSAHIRGCACQPRHVLPLDLVNF